MHPAKASVVTDLNKRLNDSPFIFVADYTGLNVMQFSELRTRLDKAGARCQVVKNSYLRLAAKGAGLPDLGELRGQFTVPETLPPDCAHPTSPAPRSPNACSRRCPGQLCTDRP